MMRILITGSAGLIGTELVSAWRDRYAVRGFDHVETPDLSDAVVGDVADWDDVHQAMADVDAVVHLAGVSAREHYWELLLPANFIGTYNVLEAARQRGVKRVVLASRAGVVSDHPRHIQRTVDTPYTPNSIYTVSKIYLEQMGQLYAQQHEMEVVALRIGNFKRGRRLPEHPHHLSYDDVVRLFERAVIHPGVKFEIVYGVSDSNWPLYDLEHGRRAIGYEPQDFSDVPEEEREG
ncbi:MAG: hypothetical protein CMJ49_11885 [Planctomycetaceae bacterium]|nr:hypothetical protein [Planctomycetaceae bacterium]